MNGNQLMRLVCSIILLSLLYLYLYLYLLCCSYEYACVYAQTIGARESMVLKHEWLLDYYVDDDDDDEMYVAQSVY